MSNEDTTYHSDYETEPIGGGNPYHRCVHCGVSVPEINGRLEGHHTDCEYRIAKEQSKKQLPDGRWVTLEEYIEEIKGAFTSLLESGEVDSGEFIGVKSFYKTSGEKRL